ncbi:hypothetical protein WR25_23947 [Diploscapter pachys]|uniref:Chitin-binding type-2 domain-containing protein n=1 Tax=Diploscapter pachys TaxID=2018661 RepID=A0A2A2JLB5_9BILA|nr:hypothetical protein WR25_23947 [Diploscapter pachys]
MLRSSAMVVWMTCLLATAWGRYLNEDDYGMIPMQDMETEAVTETQPIENSGAGSQQVQQMGYAYGNQPTTTSSELPPTSAPTQMLDIPMPSDNNYNQYSGYGSGYDEEYNSGSSGEEYNSGASGEESGSGLIGFDPIPENEEGSGEGSGLFSPSDCSNLADGNYTMSACGHQFLACSNGLPHVMDCPADLVYNAELNMCDWSHNVVGCEGSGGEITSGESVPEESGSGAASGEESGEVSGEESSGEESGLTPIEPMILPLPPVEQPATTTLPATTSTAQIQESTTESSGLELVPSTSTAEPETSGIEEMTPLAEGSSTEAEAELSGEEGSGELLGENQSTTATPSTSTIPAVTEVETEEQVQMTTAMPTSTSTQSDSAIISVVVRRSQLDESLRDQSTDCSARANGNYQLTRCSGRFLSCSNGIGHLMNCPDQLVFNAPINACDFPSALMCDEKSADTGAESDTLCSSDGMFATESCSPNFHHCINGKLFDLSCDPGQLFSWARELCLPAVEFPECDLH